MAAASLDDFPIIQRIVGLDRKSDAQAYAPCPAHPTSHDSLSIGITDKGHLGLHCFAGCSVGAILNGLSPRGLWSELFPGGGNRSSGHSTNTFSSNGQRSSGQSAGQQAGQQAGQSPNRPATAQPPGKIIAIYSYRDSADQELFQVVRYQPKNFRQRHRSADGKKWIWKSVDQSKRILYQLPSLIAAAASTPDQPVFLVEGEKDADRLRASGLIATTSPGGASSSKSKSKWLPQYTIALRPFRVFIIPDSDDTGREHAEHVARQLSEAAPGPHSFVSIVSLPILPGLPTHKKWDVSDWLDAGGTREQFFQAVAAAEQNPFDPLAIPPAIPVIGNADEDPTGALIPININEISKRIRSQTDDWPRRVGSALFVDRTELFHEQSDQTTNSNPLSH